MEMLLHTLHNIYIFVACRVIRGPGYSTFEIFDVERGQKRAHLQL